MADLERALQIAVTAHAGQKDKVGAPYVMHPLRMMATMRTDAERIVALLHDVVEDTDWTLDRLRAEGFAEIIVQAVDCLTHREDESYEAFIERARQDPIARVVKIADLCDNLDASRLNGLTETDIRRIIRYQGALARLRQRDAEPAPGA